MTTGSFASVVLTINSIRRFGGFSLEYEEVEKNLSLPRTCETGSMGTPVLELKRIGFFCQLPHPTTECFLCYPVNGACEFLWLPYEQEPYVVAPGNRVVMSPNYGRGQKYPFLVCCVWNITVPEGKASSKNSYFPAHNCVPLDINVQTQDSARLSVRSLSIGNYPGV